MKKLRLAITVAIASVSVIFLILGLLVGVYDVYIQTGRFSGSWGGGFILTLITLLPAFCYFTTFSMSLRKYQSQSWAIVQASVVGVIVGLPVNSFLFYGAFVARAIISLCIPPQIFFR
jgi:hypothetical protein